MNCNQQQPFGNTAAFQPTQQHFTVNLTQVSSPAMSEQAFFGDSFSHNSSSTSLATDGSQFPAYQLVMGQNFPNQGALGTINPDANFVLPFSFEEDFAAADSQFGDNADVLARLEIDDIPSRQPLAPTDFPVTGSSHVAHSQPINIQHHPQSTCDIPLSFADFYNSDPAVQHISSNVESPLLPLQLANPSDAIHSAPSSDIRGIVQLGNCSGYGSAISSPGEMQLQTLQRQQNFFPASHSTENFNNVTSHQAGFEFMQIGNANRENVRSVASIPANENLTSTSQHVQSPESSWSYSAGQSTLFDDGYNEVFFADTNDEQHTPFQNYSNHAAFPRESVVLSSQAISSNQISNGSPALNPNPIQVQHEINSAASQASSFSSSTYSPMSVKQEDQVFFGPDQDQSRPLTDQEKADQKRMRNNEACRRSRRKRKMTKERTEAKVYELTDENMRLKEQIRDLENSLKVARGDVERRFSQS